MEGVMDRRASGQVDMMTNWKPAEMDFCAIENSHPLQSESGRAIRQLHESPLVSFLSPSCFRLHPLPLRSRSASISSQCSQTTTPGQN